MTCAACNGVGSVGAKGKGWRMCPECKGIAALTAQATTTAPTEARELSDAEIEALIPEPVGWHYWHKVDSIKRAIVTKRIDPALDGSADYTETGVFTAEQVRDTMRAAITAECMKRAAIDAAAAKGAR